MVNVLLRYLIIAGAAVTACLGAAQGRSPQGLAETAWPKAGRDLANRGCGVGQAARGQDRWTYGADVTNGGFGTPIIGRNDTIYCNMGRSLQAVKHDGKRLWSFSYNELDFIGSPTLAADGTVYSATWSGLVAIRPAGRLKWFIRIPEPCSAPTLGDDGTIYCGSSGGRLYAIRPDGHIKWTRNYAGPESSAPAIDARGRLYFGSKDSHVYCVDPSGKIVWRYPTKWKNTTAVTLGRDGTVYMPSLDGTLYALNSQGTLQWSFDTKGTSLYHPVTIAPDASIYLVGGGNEDSPRSFLYHLDPQGHVLNQIPASVYASTAVASDGTVYLMDVTTIDAYGPDGRKKWGMIARTGGDGPSIGRDGCVYFFTEYGALRAVD